MEKFDYPKCHDEPIVTFSWPESEYVSRLRLRLAMEDILKAHSECYLTVNNKEDQDLAFADKVNEIIEGWGI